MAGIFFPKKSFVTHFWPMLAIYTPGKHQKNLLKTRRFLFCSIKKDVPKKFAIFTGKLLCWSFFLTMLQRACNFIKKRLQH